MSLLDRSHLYNFERVNGGGGLFDYQQAAVEHCLERLRQGQPAVLGLDTGLGKTCTVGEVLRRLGGTARWICPGGLVRQTVQSLREPPWGLAPGETPRTIVKAETGKQLTEISMRTERYDVAVVNRALGILRRPPRRDPDGPDEEEFTVTVIDEAHQMTPSNLRRCYGLPNAPVLLVSACARDSTTMMEAFRPHGSRRDHAWSKSYGDACFIVDKTERVLRSIGAAEPRFVSVPTKLNEHEHRRYLDRLRSGLRYQQSSRTVIRVCLAAGRLLLGPGEEASFVEIATTHAERRPPDDVIRDEVRAACYRLGLTRMPPAAIVNEERAAKRQRTTTTDSDDEEHVNHGRGACPCCSLTPVEYRLLYRYHVEAIPTERPIWALGGEAKGFCSTLVRFPTARNLEQALAAYPPPPSVDCFTLTSAKSASFRANLVKRFASHGGQRYKLCVLARAAKNGTCHPTLLKVLTIGFGYLHRELISYLAKPRLLLTDQTVDVGFDLHRHLDGLSTSHVLCSAGDMQQLVGRLARISIERIGERDTIDVVTPQRENTLDPFFAKHLMADSAVGESEDLISQRERDARRADDRRLTAEMRHVLSDHDELRSFFERIYAAAISSGLT